MPKPKRPAAKPPRAVDRNIDLPLPRGGPRPVHMPTTGGAPTVKMPTARRGPLNLKARAKAAKRPTLV